MIWLHDPWVRRRVFYLTADERELTLVIRMAREFKRINGRCRQMRHHGLFDGAKLQRSYKAAIRGMQRMSTPSTDTVRMTEHRDGNSHELDQRSS